MIDTAKYRRRFIEEGAELLRDLDASLVQAEKAARADARDDVVRAMEAAFRAAHSLKGMAAAVGCDGFATLAHRLEDLADVARKEGRLDGAGFDLLFTAADGLRALLQAIASGVADPGAPHLTAQIDQRLGGHAQTLLPQQAPSSPPPSSTSASSPPPSASPGNSGMVVLRARIADAERLPAARALILLRTLAALPGYVSVEPTTDALKGGALPDRTLHVRFAAGSDAAAVVAAALNVSGVAAADASIDAAAPAVPVKNVTADDDRASDERTVRVRATVLDDLIDSVGELLLARSRMRALSQGQTNNELIDIVDEVDRLTRDLHSRVVQARLTPLATVCDPFPRLVRDLSRKTHKSVEFSMHGVEIELDRAILDDLAAPLVHMIRNAIDHAHEGDDDREARGKPRAMQLSLRATRDRDFVMLTLDDDGAGMDPQALRMAAVQKGLLLASEAEKMSDAQALEIICMPGFSTQAQVSDTSGRGVGMDVVKANVERVGGNVQIRSTRGRGTSIVLELPLTVAILRALVVEPARGRKDAFAIPVHRVERAVELDENRISIAHGRRFLHHEGELIGLLDLGAELGLDEVFDIGTERGAGTVLLVRRGTERFGVRVAAIVGQEEVVAKPLGAPLSAVPYLAGAALLADGRAAFILEPQRLARSDGLTKESPQ